MALNLNTSNREQVARFAALTGLNPSNNKQFQRGFNAIRGQVPENLDKAKRAIQNNQSQKAQDELAAARGMLDKFREFYDPQDLQQFDKLLSQAKSAGLAQNLTPLSQQTQKPQLLSQQAPPGFEGMEIIPSMGKFTPQAQQAPQQESQEGEQKMQLDNQSLDQMRQGIRQPRLDDFRKANPNLSQALQEYQSALGIWRENRSIQVRDSRTGNIINQMVDTFDPRRGIPVDGMGNPVSLRQAIELKQTQTGFTTEPSNGVLQPYGGRGKDGQQDSQQGDVTGTPGGTGSTPSGTGPTPGGTSQVDKNAEFEQRRTEALAEIDRQLQAGAISPELAAMFRFTIQGWQPDQDINPTSILDTFNQIRENTVDPRFRSIVDQTILDYQNAKQFSEAGRESELESERFGAGENIRQAKGDLERRGLTFGGTGIRQLGALAAIGRPGSPGVTQQALSGEPEAGLTFAQLPEGLFYEGTVNQANRLISSSSELRFREQQQNLARQAESALGTTGAQYLGFQGRLARGVRGSIEEQRQQALGQTLSQIMGQQANNISQNAPSNYNLP